MASVVNRESWIRQQYYIIGLKKGEFIGKNAFKEKLFAQRPEESKDKIRQLVNRMIREGIKPEVRTVPKDDRVPIVPSSFPSKSKTAATETPALVKPKKKSHKEQKGGNTTLSIQSKKSAEKPKGGNAPSYTSNKQATQVPNGSNVASSIPKRQSAQGPKGSDAASITPTKQSAQERQSGGTASSIQAAQSTQEQTTFNPKIQELRAFLEASKCHGGSLSSKSTSTSDFQDSIQMDQLMLLDDGDINTSRQGKLKVNTQSAVLFSADALEHCDHNLTPQYGLLGSLNPNKDNDSVKAADRRIFLNTNIPFSAFICGLQGSGKSHTTGCLIENCLIRSPILGVLQKQLSVLVFHFSEWASQSSFKPSETAFLACPSPQFQHHLSVTSVIVLVSPSNYLTLRPLYMQIPGVSVRPFKLLPKNLNIGTIMTLMSVDQTQAAPLYMGQVTKILRQMASESSHFSYPTFRRRLDDADLDRKQREFLNQRLDLLESFLDLEGSTPAPAFEAGTVTIMDLSCPFVDANTACVLFKIGMGMYLESGSSTGKVIAVDEAHKYMSDTPASKALTESLLTVIRQQRHYGVRLIISTQEPTISPRLIDLCSITIIHRFSSPEWFGLLRKHVFVAEEQTTGTESRETAEFFEQILDLETGEALVFAPSAMVREWSGKEERGKRRKGLWKMRVRKRITWDGGKSLMCV